MSRIRIAPVTAVTCNDRFDVVADAAIHVDGGVITYVGPEADAPAFAAEESLGGEHLVALPGMVNTHTHAAMTLLRGYADDMPLEPWLSERIWPFEQNLTADDVYWGTLLAIAEMIRAGTTCFADMYHFYERGLDAMIESGIRAAPAGVVIGVFPKPGGQIERATAFVREYRGAGDGRIRPLLSPHSLYTCDRDQWKAVIDAARELDVPIHTHAAETRQEVQDVVAGWGRTPIRALHELGALDGPLLAAHCVWVDEEEIELMATAGGDGLSRLRVAHNATSNLKLASGIAPVPAMLRHGVTVGLGPDGAASNNTLDLWKEMRLTALLHKAADGDATVVSAREALLMATRDGARCLGLQDLTGSLEPGKKADVVLVDFDKPHLYPRHDVVSHLVYAATAADVDSVLVDGRVLLRHGEFTSLDAPRIIAEVTRCTDRLVRAARGPATAGGTTAAG